MSDYQGYPTCQHVMTNGRYCQCPAIKNTRLCVNHSEDHARRRTLALAAARRKAQQALGGEDRHDSRDALNVQLFQALQLPALEDTADIAVVLTNILRLLGAGHIPARHAEAIISACRVAGVNLRQAAAAERRSRSS